VLISGRGVAIWLGLNTKNWKTNRADQTCSNQAKYRETETCRQALDSLGWQVHRIRCSRPGKTVGTQDPRRVYRRLQSRWRPYKLTWYALHRGRLRG